MIKKLLLKIQKNSLGFDTKVIKNLDNYGYMDYEPIFIVGAPRSGSTLFFQMLVNNYKVSYISNIMSLFPKFMIGINKLFSFIKKDNKLKESDYGFVPGLQEPSEAGAIFRFWLDSSLSDDKIKSIRGTFFELSKMNKSPLVSKNLYNSLRIHKILKVFPGAKFIIINRDILYNAQSLYQSRIKNYNDDTKWFSVKPNGYEETMKKTPYYQVLWQVDRINENILESLSGVDDKNKFFVKYEEFCEKSSQVLIEMSNQFNLEFIDKSDGMKDNNVTARNKISISKDKWEKLNKIYKENFKEKK